MSTDFLQWRKHKELEQLAAALHAKYNLTVPVDIDYLVEAMGLDIRDINRLKEEHGLFGLLGKVSGKYAIFVPRGELLRSNYHTNFTIAEELAHFILHGKYFQNVEDFEGAVDFYLKISQKSKMMFEFNAKHLAGAILVPADDLKKRAAKVYGENKVIFNKVMKAGGEDSCEMIIEAIARSLSDDYQVPEGDIAYRLKRSIIGFKGFLIDECKSLQKSS